MRRLADIRSELNATHALIAQWNQRLADPSTPPSALLAVGSLEKRAHSLENELLEVANRTGADVCSYRVFLPDDTQPQVLAISKILGSFQVALSAVFDAITGEPKERARISAENAQKTALEFGYSFAGSAGFVFTIPNERLLFEDMESGLSESIRTMFDVISSTTPEEIGAHVKRIGHGGMRAIQSWAKSHASTGTGADIDWHRGQQPISAFKQFAEWRQLERAIDATSEETTHEMELLGELFAADLQSKTFRMRFEQGEPIKGHFDDAISPEHHAELPRLYKATIRKTTKVHYSLQEDEVSYFLVSLADVD
jgi:hypothetical protein